MPVPPSAASVMAEEAPEGVCRSVPPALGLLFSERLCAEEEEEGASRVTAVQAGDSRKLCPQTSLCTPRASPHSVHILYLAFATGLSVKTHFIQASRGFLFGVFSE